MVYGIWEYNAEFGLIGKPENLPEIYVSKDKIWETEDLADGKVWKWPLYFTGLDWFNPTIANDFNKAFFYAMNATENQRPQDVPIEMVLDSRTLKYQFERMSDFFPGADEEAVLEI